MYAGAIILVGVIFRKVLNDDKHIAARKGFTGFIVGRLKKCVMYSVTYPNPVGTGTFGIRLEIHSLFVLAKPELWIRIRSDRHHFGGSVIRIHCNKM